MLKRQTSFCCLWALFAVAAFAQQPASQGPATPSALFGELYVRVQTEHLFPDSKTFADAIPRKPPAEILADYRARTPNSKTALAAFVRERFTIPSAVAVPSGKPAATTAHLSLPAHIKALWPVLTRDPRIPQPNSSLLPLNWPYVVPGGRFREMYYWDSYFTMLGLAEDGKHDTIVAMTRNFADLIGRYGHIPNGTRSYYISRSQPPFFYLMVGLTDKDRAAAYAKYLPALRAEHAFWMRGAERLQPGQAFEHSVSLPDGAILNRYWDLSATPRDESYREDAALAAASSRPAEELYHDIRASAESGWDFSSRWFADGKNLGTIETTSIIPVDLNALLFGLERAIAEGCDRAGDRACVTEFQRRASDRKAAVTQYLWDGQGNRFLDYHWQRRALLDRPSAAMLYPLFTGLADAEQAKGVAAATSSMLLAPGGVLSTPQRTGQQWDAPNGWAPHQWIAVVGLDSYGHSDLARTIAIRWLTTVTRAYRETGKLLEKYDVQEVRPGGGGEYPLQDGFGWTNGVTQALLTRYPDAATNPKPH